MMRINWIAVGVSGVLYWLLQAVWFTVFSSQWVYGLRMTAEELARYQAQPSFWPYVVALFSNLVIAYIIAEIMFIYGKSSLLDGLRIGTLVGSVACAAVVTNNVFLLHSFSFLLVSAAIIVIGGALMGAVLGAWKTKPNL